MSWGHPLLAVALPLGVALAWLLAALWSRRVRQRQRALGTGVPHLTTSVGRRREAWRSGLLWSGLLALAVALAGPRWGSESVEQHQSGADILLLMDCSRSMLTTDIYPTRIEAARRKALDLLEQAPELRIALMPFAALPILRCPFTGDHAALEEILKDCSPDMFPVEDGMQGTAIGAGVTEGLNLLSHGAERGQAILIMSDGMDDDQASVEKAGKAAKDAGIPVFGLFFGDPAAKSTLTLDGQNQAMDPQRQTLEKLADATGGICVTATRDDADVVALIGRIEHSLKLGVWESHARIVASDRYQWPLGIGIALIVLGALLPSRRHEPRRAAAGTVLAARALPLAILLAGALSGLAAEDPWDALSQAVSEPPDQARKDIEALLLDHPAFYAAQYDLGTLLLQSDPVQAVAHLREATQATDIDLAADSYLNLALALLAQGRLDDALVAAASAYQLKPALSPDVNQLRAKVIAIKDEARRKAEEDAKKLHLLTVQLPPATVAEAYSTIVLAAGGTGIFRFAPLKDAAGGLVLDVSGLLHGAPTKTGSLPLAITVADGTSTITRTLTLQVLPPPTIVPDLLPEAILGQPYRAELAAIGLEHPSWSVHGLNPGLMLTDGATPAQAVISGTPTTVGTCEVTCAARDGARQARRSYHLVVSDSFAPDVIDLPPATSGSPYQDRPSVRGPAQDYRWSMAEPVNGLQVGPDGTIAGIPLTDGASSLPVTISASDGRTRTFDLRLHVNPPPVISEDKPISITAERPVQQSLHVTGGTPPYQWQVTDGTLPNGLRLEPGGILSGATTARGDSTVTVAVTDRWQAAAHKPITISVTAPPLDQKKPPPDQDQKDQDQRKDQDQKKDQSQQASNPAQDQKGSHAQDQKQQDQKSGSQSGQDHSPANQQGQSAQSGQQGQPGQQSAGQPGQDQQGQSPSPNSAGQGQQPQAAQNTSPQGSSSQQGDATHDQGENPPGQQPAAAQGPPGNAPSNTGAGAQQSPPPSPPSGTDEPSATPLSEHGDKTPSGTPAGSAAAAAAAGGTQSGQGAEVGVGNTGGTSAERARRGAELWIESLPPENHEALREQMLHNVQPPAQRGNPW